MKAGMRPGNNSEKMEEDMTGIKTRATALSCALALGIIGAATQAAHAEFPEKPINIIVGLGAGGGTDATIRALAEPLSRILGQPIMVANRPGAGGAVAALSVSTAPADGYTLVAGNSTSFSLEPQFVDIAYSIDDFDHVAIVLQFQEGFVTKSDNQHDTLRELLDAHKASGEPIQYASYYQVDRLITDYLSKKEGVAFEPIPNGGAGPSLTSVLGGHAAFTISGGSFAPHVQSGEAKLLGSAMRDRLEKFPDIEGMADLGYDVGTENHLLISAPKGVPEDVLKRLSDAIAEAMNDPQVERILESRFMRKSVHLLDEVNPVLERQFDMYKEMIAISNE